MGKIFSELFFFPSVCYATAVQAADDVPAEGAGSLATIIFGIIFLGFCVGFVWMIWRNEKKKKRGPE